MFVLLGRVVASEPEPPEGEPVSCLRVLADVIEMASDDDVVNEPFCYATLLDHLGLLGVKEASQDYFDRARLQEGADVPKGKGN